MLQSLKSNILEFFENHGVTATPETVVERLAQDYPEVVLLLAEENYLRGYAQGITDVRSMGNEESDKNK